MDRSVQVTNLNDARSGSRLQRVLNGLMQVHYGEFAGISSPLLWCVTGFAPSILFLSGLLLWRRRILSAQVARGAMSARTAFRTNALA